MTSDLEVPDELVEGYAHTADRVQTLTRHYWVNHGDGTAEGCAKFVHQERLQAARDYEATRPQREQIERTFATMRALHLCDACGEFRPGSGLCDACDVIASTIAAAGDRERARLVRRYLAQLAASGHHQYRGLDLAGFTEEGTDR